MKLNLEFKHKFSMWRCWAGIPSCGKQAVVGATQSSTTPCGLCLEHLPLLKDMAWAEAFIPQEITGTLRDAVIAEFYRVFPEPEPEPLVACPVCGEQPKWRECNGSYSCDGGHEGDVFHFVYSSNQCSEPLARAAWNSMRREPVPAPKYRLWLKMSREWSWDFRQTFNTAGEAEKFIYDNVGDDFRYIYEVREVPA